MWVSVMVRVGAATNWQINTTKKYVTEWCEMRGEVSGRGEARRDKIDKLLRLMICYNSKWPRVLSWNKRQFGRHTGRSLPASHCGKTLSGWMSHSCVTVTGVLPLRLVFIAVTRRPQAEISYLDLIVWWLWRVRVKRQVATQHGTHHPSSHHNHRCIGVCVCVRAPHSGSPGHRSPNEPRCFKSILFLVIFYTMGFLG